VASQPVSVPTAQSTTDIGAATRAHAGARGRRRVREAHREERLLGDLV